SPTYKLDVAGDAGFSQYLYHNEDEDTYIKFTTDQIDMYAGGVWLLSADETTQDEVVINEGSVDLDFRVESDNSSYALFVRGSDGYVGIGTDSPDYLLDVDGDAGFNEHIYHNGDENTYIKFTYDQIDLYAGDVWMISAEETTQDEVVINEGSVDVDFRVESDNSSYALFVRGSDGYVGIGTDSPNYLLDVDGDAGFNEHIYHNGDENTYIKFSSDQIDLYAGGVWLLSADEATQDEVVINEGSADVDFRVESDDDNYAFFVRGSDGKIGMGTSSPDYKLDVESSAEACARFTTTYNGASAYGCRAEADPGGNYDAVGVYGVCTPADHWGYGVYGEGGYMGLKGYLSQTGLSFCNYYGVRGSAGLSSGLGTAFGVYGSGSGGASHYGVYYSGGLGGTGTKSAIVRTEEGPKAVYCQESPENWFEDFGSGQIHGDRAEIRLAHDFRQTVTVTEMHPMKVFITPNARLGEWWVKKGTTGFTLMAPEAPDGAKFDYRVVAKRRGYEDLRLQPAPAAYADHFLYPNVEEVPPEYQADWLKSLPDEQTTE
ncbi:hypothetical protein KAU04_06505, partial [bacterium]|nr:hypothetical protein [bacterium]